MAGFPDIPIIFACTIALPTKKDWKIQQKHHQRKKEEEWDVVLRMYGKKIRQEERRRELKGFWRVKESYKVKVRQREREREGGRFELEEIDTEIDQR